MNFVFVYAYKNFIYVNTYILKKPKTKKKNTTYTNFVYVNTYIFKKPKTKKKTKKYHIYKLCIRMYTNFIYVRKQNLYTYKFKTERNQGKNQKKRKKLKGKKKEKRQIREKNQKNRKEKPKGKKGKKKGETCARGAPAPFHCGPPLRACHVAAPCGRGGAGLIAF